MRLIDIVIGGLPLLVCAIGVPRTLASQDSAGVAFVGVTVLDPGSGRARPAMTVVVRENRIVAVQPTRPGVLAASVRVVDGKGKFLMPGLWDMHVHLGSADQPALPMLVAFGVTGVRDMGSDLFQSLRQWRIDILAGRRVGPRIVAPGPIVDGPTPNWPIRVTVRNAEEARAAVDSLAVVGVDFIKVHQQLTRDGYFAVAAEARKLNLVFAGHVPVEVSGIEAAAAGQRSFEHLTGIPNPGDSLLGPTLAALAKHSVWVDPTMINFWTMVRLTDSAVANDPRNRYISASLRKFWEDQKAGWSGDLSIEGLRATIRSQVATLQALHRSGISILAGTDLGFVSVYPGSGLHDELDRLVEAGYRPNEAIAAATINPARYFGRDAELGSIEVGKLADLVLLSANPFADIKNTRKIDAVMANGRLFDRGALDELMEEVAREVSR